MLTLIWLRLLPHGRCMPAAGAGTAATARLPDTPPPARPCPPPQVEWVKSRIASVPVRLVFESSLELMEATQVGCGCS